MVAVISGVICENLWKIEKTGLCLKDLSLFADPYE